MRSVAGAVKPHRKGMTFTISTVGFVRVVSAIIVTVTQVTFRDTLSTWRTLKLTWAARTCITPNMTYILTQFIFRPFHFIFLCLGTVWKHDIGMLRYAQSSYYGRPLSVSGRPCYILPMFFIYLFFYGRLILRPWWTEVRKSITRGGPWVALEKLLFRFFFWSSLNYRVGQNVTKFGVFSDSTRKLSALTPERGRIL